MITKTTICEIGELKATGSALLDEVVSDLHLYHKSSGNVAQVKRNILDFLEELRNDLIVVMEADYVDRDYRDSYYTYFSTKLLPYSRTCIRMSFFTADLPRDFSIDDKATLQKEYLGFVVLRPLVKCIGRNVMSPKAKIGNSVDALICQAKVNTTCMGVKLVAEGFHHASQDEETMTCAQTTIWALLEYFGNRYVEYMPTLPSKIKEVLTPFSYERQLPSSGLNFEQISVALRELGFGAKVYMAPILPDNPSKTDKEAFDKALLQYKETLYCYIESGVPLALCLDNGTIGHAVVAIGRPKIQSADIVKGKSALSKGKSCFLWNLALDKLVVNDDNFPCYQVTQFDDPSDYYVKKKYTEWAGMKITHFIAPLYNKVYMDAEVAIEASKFLAADLLRVPSNCTMRTYLTSSRTYREHIALNQKLDAKQKEALLSFAMPKFVWITEISSLNKFKKGLVESTIVIDATAGKIRHMDSVIYILTSGNIFLFDDKAQGFVSKKVTVPTEIDAFKGNLK